MTQTNSLKLSAFVAHLNGKPDHVFKALECVYRGKVFIVYCPALKTLEAFKTRRGAEGYKSREESFTYYSEHTNDVTSPMVYEIYEVSADEIKDPLTDKKMWYNALYECFRRSPKKASSTANQAKNKGVEAELLKWIEETAEEIYKHERMPYIEFEEVQEQAEEQQTEVTEVIPVIEETQTENIDMAAVEEEVQPEGKHFVKNLETNRIELKGFSKEEYMSMKAEDKAELKRWFKFSPFASGWVSKATQNHYYAEQAAKQLGFVKAGKVGERLTFAEQQERKVERAEARAERLEGYAVNAQQRGASLTAELESYRGDISFFTQPIIAGHSGSQAFARRRERIFDRFGKGVAEYRKSDYFKDRAATARATADQKQLKDRTYLNNRIEECQKEIRALERLIIQAEEKNKNEWLERLFDNLEQQLDKLAYFTVHMDAIGGVQYNKDNVKVGYLIKVRGCWATVTKANTKTVMGSYVEERMKHCFCTYPYAEIQELIIPEGWAEPKKELDNPFNVNDIVIRTSFVGNRAIDAFQIIRVAGQSVEIKQIALDDSGTPLKDQFKSNNSQRRKVKKDRSGKHVVNSDDYYLYKYDAANNA